MRSSPAGRNGVAPWDRDLPQGSIRSMKARVVEELAVDDAEQANVWQRCAPSQLSCDARLSYGRDLQLSPQAKMRPQTRV